MASPPAIVHLIGYPAAGKFTISQATSQIAQGDGQRFVVVDNHHTAT